MDGFEQMSKLGEAGRGAALELMQISAENSSSQIRYINRLGEKLKAIDLDLFRLGYSHPELMPLVAQFTYGKDNLSGWALDNLARETARLYTELLSWNNMLKRWIESISQSIKQALAGETAA